ncbi:small auxin-up RNA [Artemisia annua]|uniref:Small auxin-up RNA n=1 Tax=Artemisia annua TaxID=35608 RepID=A0A2U1M3T5_ARTAN|nr:small auxin-up RNA [Artemisia annua]
MGKLKGQSLAKKNIGIFKLKLVVEKVQKTDDDEEKRFVVPLVYLGHPSFQRLLERAAEEYRFNHEGALTVPCRPSELECMLTQRGSSLGDDIGWSSFKTMVDDMFDSKHRRSGWDQQWYQEHQKFESNPVFQFVFHQRFKKNTFADCKKTKLQTPDRRITWFRESSSISDSGNRFKE